MTANRPRGAPLVLETIKRHRERSSPERKRGRESTTKRCNSSSFRIRAGAEADSTTKTPDPGAPGSGRLLLQLPVANHPRTKVFTMLLKSLVAAAIPLVLLDGVGRAQQLTSDIPYVENGHERQVLDVYTPERVGGEKLPVFFWIHGGGWQTGYQPPATE